MEENYYQKKEKNKKKKRVAPTTSRMEDNDDKGGHEEGWHHENGEVALFCLILSQAIFKGKQVGDWKRVKPHEKEGRNERRTPLTIFFPSIHPKKGRTLMCFSRLKSVFNVCLCSFSKLKKRLKEQQKPHQLTNQRFTVNSSSSSPPPNKIPIFVNQHEHTCSICTVDSGVLLFFIIIVDHLLYIKH